MALRAYEGSEKYAFISYAHKDSEQVLKILGRMADERYRVWYDEGIAPGSEWPEDIARHLNDCAVTVAFVSNNSIASANCRREVTFALAKHKPFLGVLLEPTEMSLGMELQLSAQQCILRHNFTNEEDFIQKILSSPDLQPCRDVVVIQQPEEEEAAPVFVPVQTSAPAPEQPAAKAVPRKEKAPKPPKAPKEQKARPEKNAAAKKKLPLPAILGAIAVVILAIVLLGGGKEELPNGTKIDTKSEYLTLSDINFDDAAQTVRGMKNLTALTLNDCTVTSAALDFLPESGVKYLTLSNCTGITDFSFLTEMTQLRALEITDCGLDDSFDLTGHSSLYDLTLNGNKDFTDLSRLPLAQLTGLSFADTGVTDTAPLSVAAKLISVDGSGCALGSIDALAELTALETLAFSNCGLQSISAPFMSLKVRAIDLSGNDLADLDTFASNFTVLTSVDVSENDLKSVDWLGKSSASLQTLDLRNNRLAFDDLHILPAMTKLRSLYLQDMDTLRDLTDIAPLTNLETLVINNTYLESIEGIAALTKLTRLDLRHNRIADLSPLNGMTFPDMMALDLAENRITDISPIPRGSYRLLALHDNHVTFAADSLAGLSGYYLTVDYHESLDSCTDAKGFTWPFALDCPTDKQLDIKDVLGYGVTYATGETIDSLLTEKGYTLGK